MSASGFGALAKRPSSADITKPIQPVSSKKTQQRGKREYSLTQHQNKGAVFQKAKHKQASVLCVHCRWVVVEQKKKSLEVVVAVVEEKWACV